MTVLDPALLASVIALIVALGAFTGGDRADEQDLDGEP